jgi:hypothetical protein
MFQLNEYEFHNISTERNINIEYFHDVLKLVSKHKAKLLHDYLPQDIEGIVRLVDKLYPWFFLVFKNNELMSFMYCYDWLGNGKDFHSCCITGCATKNGYGKDTRKILTLFCNYLYDALGLVKVKAEVNKENTLCINLLESCRFKKEGFLKCNTLNGGKPQDTLIFGKINPVYLSNLKYKDDLLLQTSV